MNRALTQAIKHWSYIAPLIKQPSNSKELDKLVVQLDELLEIVGDDEDHYLMGLVDILSNLIASYEGEHYQKMQGKSIDALKFLIASHHLRQSDLSEIGSQGVISEILSGKRSLNLRQIKLLAERFNVDPATFMDN